MSEGEKKQAAVDLRTKTPTDLFCLFNDWLAEALPPDQAKAVA